MNKRIVFRHMDADKVIEDYINKHLEKVERALENEPSPVTIDFTITPSKTREHHRVELRVKSVHYDLIAEHEKQGTPFYQAIDHVIDVMYRNIHDAKARRIESRNHPHDGDKP